MLPFVLAGATHHQQVAVTQPPGERGPAVFAMLGVAVPAHLKRTALADAQTSGGLLICVPPDGVDELLEELEGRAPASAVVGRMVEGPVGAVEVV